MYLLMVNLTLMSLQLSSSCETSHERVVNEYYLFRDKLRTLHQVLPLLNELCLCFPERPKVLSILHDFANNSLYFMNLGYQRLWNY